MIPRPSDLKAFLRGIAAVAALMLTLHIAPHAARAATDLREYNIELVVFENRDDQAPSESLPIDINIHIPEQTVGFDDAGALRAARQLGFVPLEPGRGGLRELVDRLNRSSRYRIILYRAWRQPGLPLETAVPVRIHGGTDYTGRYEIPRPARVPVEGVFSAPPQQTPRIERQLLEEIDGTVTVSLQRYLHVSTDLMFLEPDTAPMPPEVPEQPGIQEQGVDEAEGMRKTSANTRTASGSTYPDQSLLVPGQPYLQPHTLKERRRMRSREIHYFDNPRFGLITLITPHEPETQN